MTEKIILTCSLNTASAPASTVCPEGYSVVATSLYLPEATLTPDSIQYAAISFSMVIIAYITAKSFGFLANVLR